MTSWRTFICKHVTEEGRAVLTVYHDGEDHYLEAMCGAEPEAHPVGSLVVESWGCVRERDPSLVELEPHLTPFTWCSREVPGAAWIVEPDAEEAA